MKGILNCSRACISYILLDIFGRRVGADGIARVGLAFTNGFFSYSSLASLAQLNSLLLQIKVNERSKDSFAQVTRGMIAELDARLEHNQHSLMLSEFALETERLTSTWVTHGMKKFVDLVKVLS